MQAIGLSPTSKPENSGQERIHKASGLLAIYRNPFRDRLVDPSPPSESARASLYKP